MDDRLGAERQRMNPRSDTKDTLTRVERERNLFQQVWRYQASISIDAGLDRFYRYVYTVFSQGKRIRVHVAIMVELARRSEHPSAELGRSPQSNAQDAYACLHEINALAPSLFLTSVDGK